MAFFGIFIILLAVGVGFVALTVSCSWGAAAAMLISGTTIKLANKKLGWHSFTVYSNVLLITGAVFTFISIVYTVGIVGGIIDIFV